MEPKKYSLLTPAERRVLRLEYVEVQGGECWYCQGQLEKDPPRRITDKRINWSAFPQGFLKNPVHLHHDHNTDLTIGAVHAYCNAVLWEYHGQ